MAVKRAASKPRRSLYTDKDRDRLPPARPRGDEVQHRTPFRQDFQRLVHSASFRRLQGKMQLYPFNENDYFRTRLTHSIEVASIGKYIAHRLNKTDADLKDQEPDNQLDLDLIEFACLAHDLGHPPFGHNGEMILDDLMYDEGGFESNAQTLRILTTLEKKVTLDTIESRQISGENDVRRGLGISYRGLASVLKYDRLIPRTEEGRDKIATSPTRNENLCKGYYKQEEVIVRDIKNNVVANSAQKNFKTIECSIMDVADDIAYSTYDLDDSFVAGFLNPLTLITLDDKTKAEVAQQVKAKIDKDYPEKSADERKFGPDELSTALVRVFGELMISEDKRRDIEERDWYIDELTSYLAGQFEQASQRVARNGYTRGEFTADRLFHLMNSVELLKVPYDNPVLWQARPTLKAFQEIETLKLINYQMLIKSDKFLAERHRADVIMRSIFDALVSSGKDLLTKNWREVYEFYEDDKREKYRTICDFIAGMTDRFCVEFYTRLFGAVPPSIQKP